MTNELGLLEDLPPFPAYALPPGAFSGFSAVHVTLSEESRPVLHSDAIETVFTVTVTNRSDFPIRVIGVALIGHEEPVRSYFVGDTSDLPRTVEPRDAEVIDVPLSAVSGELPRGLAQGWVQLSTGEELRSGPTELPTIRDQGP